MNKIEFVLMLGGFGAALAICVVGVLGLVVWLAGGRSDPPE
jgi:hypothetical protein